MAVTGADVSEQRWVELEQSDNGVRTLTMNKPPVNALGRELADDLQAAFEYISRDEAARCVVLRTGLKHFCAGADLKERRDMSVEEVRNCVPGLARMNNALASMPVPTIAAVRGAAAGGGLELALACDIRIMAEDVKTGLRETALAIIPGAGGTQRLPRLIGPSRAKRWIFSARLFSAEEALRDGVADLVVPTDRLDEEADDLACAIAANGPVALRLAKKAIDRGTELPLAKAIDFEWECYKGVLETEDRIEALNAFMEKRPPAFKGR